MGKLSTFIDVTGKMDDIKINAENIKNIIDEFNRSSDQLDALSANRLKIITKGTVSIVYDGTAFFFQQTDIPINSSGISYSFLAFFTRSDLPGKLFMVPQYIFVPASAGKLILEVLAFTQNDTFSVFLQGHQDTGTPATYTFYYFIIQQPANITG